MLVLVTGAHGQVGQHIVTLLSESDHSVRAMVRKEEQRAELEALGAEVVVADLKGKVAHAVEGCDAIIFAVGSGGQDVEGIDRDGAVRLIQEAERQGVERFVMLSSVAANEPGRGPEALRPYLKAKGEADARLQASELTYTVVRPGRLTDEPPTGKVKVAERFEGWGDVTRADVAKALVFTLDLPSTYGKTFEMFGGEMPIQEALNTLMDQ